MLEVFHVLAALEFDFRIVKDISLAWVDFIVELAHLHMILKLVYLVIFKVVVLNFAIDFISVVFNFLVDEPLSIVVQNVDI